MRISQEHMAAPAAQQGMTGPKIKVLAFRLGDRQLCVDISDVREVVHKADITPVAKSQPYVEGVINLRGEILPVVSLRKRLNLDTDQPPGSYLIVVVEIDRKRIGMHIDEVLDVIKLKRSDFTASEEGGPCVAQSTSHNGQKLYMIDLASTLEIYGPASVVTPA